MDFCTDDYELTAEELAELGEEEKGGGEGEHLARLTEEQRAIATCTPKPGEAILAQAVAGSGKTTTLLAYILEHGNTSILYVCYNKSVQQEAESRLAASGMRHGAVPKTFDSIAFQWARWKYPGVVPSPGWRDVKKMLEADYRAAAQAYSRAHGGAWVSWFKATRAVDLHCTKCVSYDDMACVVAGSDAAASSEVTRAEAEMGRWLEAALHDLGEAFKEGAAREFCLPFTVMEKWCSEDADFIMREYETILVDEGQDVNPTLLTLMARQTHAGLLFAGDAMQSLYQFRHCVSVFRPSVQAKWMPGAWAFSRMGLTTSFRFGPQVAAAATAVCKAFGEEVGMGDVVVHGQEGVETEVDVVRSIDYPRECRRSKDVVVICRKRVTVLKEAYKMACTRGSPPVSLAGNLTKNIQSEINMAMMRIRAMKSGTASQQDIDEMKEEEEESGIVALVDKHGKKAVQDMLDAVSAARPNRRLKDCPPAITFTTPHSYKGLEAETVIVTTDLGRSSFYVWYTAMTRAVRRLVLAYGFARVLEEKTEWRHPKMATLSEQIEAEKARRAARAGAGSSKKRGFEEEDEGEEEEEDLSAFGPPPADEKAKEKKQASMRRYFAMKKAAKK